VGEIRAGFVANVGKFRSRWRFAIEDGIIFHLDHTIGHRRSCLREWPWVGATIEEQWQRQQQQVVANFKEGIE